MYYIWEVEPATTWGPTMNEIKKQNVCDMDSDLFLYYIASVLLYLAV